jgi:hypothetical protein
MEIVTLPYRADRHQIYSVVGILRSEHYKLYVKFDDYCMAGDPSQLYQI